VELFRRTHRILSCHRVSHEKDFLRVQQLIQDLHFAHQIIIDVQTACGIHNQEIAS
jgi:hypothetical protein